MCNKKGKLYQQAEALNDMGYIVLITGEGFEVRDGIAGPSVTAANPMELDVLLETLRFKEKTK